MPENLQNYCLKKWQPQYREVTANIIKTVLAEYGLPWQPQEADIDVIEVEKYYLQSGGEFWLIEDTITNKIIGTGAFYPIDRGEKAVEIRKMYILSTYRGQGLGKLILRHLEERIKKQEYQQIWIETASVLVEAVALYEKSRYQPAEGVETARCDRVYVKYI